MLFGQKSFRSDGHLFSVLSRGILRCQGGLIDVMSKNLIEMFGQIFTCAQSSHDDMQRKKEETITFFEKKSKQHNFM